jgi:hypothetical protein
LNNLLENYLEPLKKETFLSNAEINALFGNIQEIVAFQRQFLQNLDEALELEPDFHKFEHPSQFKVSTSPASDRLVHVFVPEYISLKYNSLLFSSFPITQCYKYLEEDSLLNISKHI